MRNIFLIIFSMILSANSCSQDCNKQCEAERKVRKLITGKWVLKTDKKYIMEIKNDTIIHYYKKKVEGKNYFILSFQDSLWLDEEEENVFRLEYGRVEIKEFDPAAYKYPTIYTILYLDEDGMDLFSGASEGNFNKIK